MNLLTAVAFTLDDPGKEPKKLGTAPRSAPLTAHSTTRKKYAARSITRIRTRSFDSLVSLTDEPRPGRRDAAVTRQT